MANILMWEGVIAQLISMGVKSWSSIKALMVDAGLDDVTILALEPKWNELYDRVKEASGQ